MLGLGYFHTREQVFAGAAAHIRQLESFAVLQESYARQWIEGSVMPILRVLEVAGPERYYASEGYRRRLEKAIMAAMPAGRGEIRLRVYLEDPWGRMRGTRFVRGGEPFHFTPDEEEIRRAFLSVADDKGSWRILVEGGGGEKDLTARYYAPIFKRDKRRLRSRFGVLAVEIPLAWLAGRIRSVSTTPGSHIFFMDKGGGWTLPDPDALAADGKRPGETAGLFRLHRLMAVRQAGQAEVPWEGKPHVAVFTPLRSGDLMLGMLIPSERLLGTLNHKVMLYAAAGLALFLFALFSLRRTAGLILGPVRELSRDAERLSAGDFSHEPEKSGFPHARCAVPLPGGNRFRPDEPGRLKNAAAQLRTALRQRQRDLMLLAATRERLFGEIALAGKLQQALRRGEAELPENISVAAELHPAGPIARDILDYFSVGPDTLCCIMASVTAQGIPAALLMDRVMPLLHELLSSGASPADALENTNIILHSYTSMDKTEMSPFVSVFIGMLCAKDGTLVWACAGKNPPYRVFAGKAEALPWSGAFPLGVMREAVYHNQSATFSPGESLFVCGTRLLAMPSPSGAIFGEDHVLSLLRNSTGTPARLLGTIHAACLAHIGSGTPPDDIAMLAVRWLGGRQA